MAGRNYTGALSGALHQSYQTYAIVTMAFCMDGECSPRTTIDVILIDVILINSAAHPCLACSHDFGHDLALQKCQNRQLTIICVTVMQYKRYST